MYIHQLPTFSFLQKKYTISWQKNIEGFTGQTHKFNKLKDPVRHALADF